MDQIDVNVVISNLRTKLSDSTWAIVLLESQVNTLQAEVESLLASQKKNETNTDDIEKSEVV